MRSDPELPEGAVLLFNPVTDAVGNWAKMEFDAEVMRYGQRWFRVRGGMGGRGDREDWVMDVPGLCVAVHDYHWNGSQFGPNHGSFDNAIKEEMKGALARAQRTVSTMRELALQNTRAIGMLRAAVLEAECQ